jgi:hypothetical protein
MAVWRRPNTSTHRKPRASSLPARIAATWLRPWQPSRWSIAAAAFEAALLPGIVLGVAAVAAPKYLPKMGAALNPVFRSTVRGAYEIGQKTKEMLAEAHEQVNDIVAEVHAEGDVNQPASKPTAASAS